MSGCTTNDWMRIKVFMYISPSTTVMGKRIKVWRVKLKMETMLKAFAASNGSDPNKP